MVRASRVMDFGDRTATLLESGRVRAVIADKGGMVPELSFPSGNGWFNTHWLPWFRSNSGRAFDPDVDAEVWLVELLHHLAGNFACLPNFGGPCSAYGYELPPHGITANGVWTAASWGTVGDRAAYVRSTIGPHEGYPSIPLEVTKYDVVFAGRPGHYVYLTVRNTGDRPYRTNLGWHNTIGAPFLSPGCRIDLSAQTFATTPEPSEFDDTTRLVAGAEFDDLSAAPLAAGGTVDLTVVPGMIGWTDFITGAVPASAAIGWSAVVNPHVGGLYLSVFRGPATVGDDEIPILFNDLWMQYGGRPFSPWGARSGGTDYTYCLGAENATGAYANGLEYSLEHPEVLGHPTTVEIAPGEVKRHVYATFVLPYEDGVLDAGVDRVEGAHGTIDVVPRSGGKDVKIDTSPDLSDLEETVGDIG